MELPKIDILTVADKEKLVRESQLADTGLNCKTPVARLQEVFAKRGIVPKYELLQIRGHVTGPVFKYAVSANTELKATGVGNSKKAAKHNAAKNLLDLLVGKISLEQAYKTDGTTEYKMAAHNPIGWLQETCTSRHWPIPTYNTYCEVVQGIFRFTVECLVFEFREVGTGDSIKMAKRIAAIKMNETLKDNLFLEGDVHSADIVEDANSDDSIEENSAEQTIQASHVQKLSPGKEDSGKSTSSQEQAQKALQPLQLPEGDKTRDLQLLYHKEQAQKALQLQLPEGNKIRDSQQTSEAILVQQNILKISTICREQTQKVLQPTPYEIRKKIRDLKLINKLNHASQFFPELKDGKIETLSQEQSQRVREFYEKLELSQDKKIHDLQTMDFDSDNLDFVKLLEDIASEQNLYVSYKDFGQKTTTGHSQCYVQVFTTPLAVCLGTGESVGDAQSAAARNVLEYLKLMPKQ